MIRWYWIWYNRNPEKHGSALGKVGRRPWPDWPGGCFESKWIYEPIEDEM